jgi:hypothetical protein
MTMQTLAQSSAQSSARTAAPQPPQANVNRRRPVELVNHDTLHRIDVHCLTLEASLQQARSAVKDAHVRALANGDREMTRALAAARWALNECVAAGGHLGRAFLDLADEMNREVEQ